MDWSRVKAVFLAAVEEAAEDRSAFLDRAPAELRMAQIHERAGRSEEASRHRARYVLLWREAEPAIREAWERSAR